MKGEWGVCEWLAAWLLLGTPEEANDQQQLYGNHVFEQCDIGDLGRPTDDGLNLIYTFRPGLLSGSDATIFEVLLPEDQVGICNSWDPAGLRCLPVRW